MTSNRILASPLQCFSPVDTPFDVSLAAPSLVLTRPICPLHAGYSKFKVLFTLLYTRPVLPSSSPAFSTSSPLQIQTSQSAQPNQICFRLARRSLILQQLWLYMAFLLFMPPASSPRGQLSIRTVILMTDALVVVHVYCVFIVLLR